MRTWWSRLLWPMTESEELLELRAKVQALQLENDLLGEVNENLRKWLLANTAAAAGIVNAMTSPEESPRRNRA